ncbi:DUF1661 domain-containing protein [Porphyromonas gulae]|uniref:DUF1661 domain-containing protein n=1 Tax=Porphyromonas gulae TaxID=111105 RepID=UPI0034E9776B
MARKFFSSRTKTKKKSDHIFRNSGNPFFRSKSLCYHRTATILYPFVRVTDAPCEGGTERKPISLPHVIEGKGRIRSGLSSRI